MITILHWINLDRLFRCHLSFHDEPKIKNYFLTEKIPNGLTNQSDHIICGNPRNIKFLMPKLEEEEIH